MDRSESRYWPWEGRGEAKSQWRTTSLRGLFVEPERIADFRKKGAARCNERGSFGARIVASSTRLTWEAPKERGTRSSREGRETVRRGSLQEKVSPKGGRMRGGITKDFTPRGYEKGPGVLQGKGDSFSAESWPLHVEKKLARRRGVKMS